jgi:hypothetical protein
MDTCRQSRDHGIGQRTRDFVTRECSAVEVFAVLPKGKPAFVDGSPQVFVALGDDDPQIRYGAGRMAVDRTTDGPMTSEAG